MIDEYLDAFRAGLGECPVFKCPYKDCPLIYLHLASIKRHLEICTFRKSLAAEVQKCPVADCSFIGRLDSHTARHGGDASIKRNSVQIDALLRAAGIHHDPYCNRQSHVCVSDLDEAAGGIFSTFFPEGVMVYQSRDDEVFACCIPGCGRMFRQMSGYKLHFKTFSHSAAGIIRAYEAVENTCVDVPGTMDAIRGLVGGNVFFATGLIHYSIARPDLDIPVKIELSQPLGSARREKCRKRDLSLFQQRPGCMDQMSIEQYRKKTRVERMERPIEEISFQDRRLRAKGRTEVGNLAIHNVGECITTSSLPQKHGKYLFVGVKDLFEPESSFRFSSGSSRIHLLDQSLFIKHTLVFEFGFCRKIETCQRSEPIRCVALFNDGFIRRFEFDGNVSNLTTIDASGIIDFDISWEKDLILATNGLSLIQIASGIVSYSEWWDKSLITSVAVRLSPQDDGGVELYSLSLDGKITRLLRGLEKKKEIHFPSGYTLVRYLPDTDTVVIVDTLNNATRMLHHASSTPKTCTLLDHAASFCVNNGKRIVAGGFDGAVRHVQLTKKGAKSKVVFQLARRDTRVALCCLDEEFQQLGSRRLHHDYAERVVGIHFGESHLFVTYSCGIAVGIAL